MKTKIAAVVFLAVMLGGAVFAVIFDDLHPRECVVWRIEKVTRCVEEGVDYCRAYGQPHDEKFCVEWGRR